MNPIHVFSAKTYLNRSAAATVPRESRNHALTSGSSPVTNDESARTLRSAHVSLTATG